jgi:hypothetical protein
VIHGHHLSASLHAAESLGVTRRVLGLRVRKYRIPPRRFRDPPARPSPG